MKIRELFGLKEPVFSFEFFPPKTPEGEAQLFRTLHELRALKPSYVSVTYGAGGSTRGKTVAWIKRIQEEVGLTAMAHLTCSGSTREELGDILGELQAAGAQNVLALRGDPPKGKSEFEAVEGGFRYAGDLVSFIRQGFGDTFSLGGACYPEGHPEATSQQADLESLKRKVDAGLDFAVSQLFFNNAMYFGFVERARRAGVWVPIVPGLMPVTNLSQLRRFSEMCGASLPAKLLSNLEKAADSESAVLEIGIEWTTRQAEELLAGGAPGIHFYTLNKSPATRRVMENLSKVVR
jgi:methylenetetrahydrofolate reductase (NADPH)